MTRSCFKGEGLAFGLRLAISSSGALARPTELRKVLDKMLFTIAIVLIVLWALGLVSAYTMGGFIHILLILAIAIFLIRLMQGRRAI
jgi:hypothetical protein